MDCKDRPMVGVGVFIYNSMYREEILLGKRKGAHGEGEWSLPGGHLEFKESFLDCCVREVKEETDLDIPACDIKKLGFTNDIFESDGLHYVTLFFEIQLRGPMCKYIPEFMEPDKCEGWGWFNLNKLPQPLFPPLEGIIKKKTVIEIKL